MVAANVHGLSNSILNERALAYVSFPLNNVCRTPALPYPACTCCHLIHKIYPTSSPPLERETKPITHYDITMSWWLMMLNLSSETVQFPRAGSPQGSLCYYYRTLSFQSRVLNLFLEVSLSSVHPMTFQPDEIGCVDRRNFWRAIRRPWKDGVSDYYTLFDPSTGMVKRLGPRLCDPRSLLPLPSERGEFTQTRAHHFGQLYTSYQVQGWAKIKQRLFKLVERD